MISIYLVLLSNFVSSRSRHEAESASLRGFSFLQLGLDFSTMATSATAFLPPHMQGVAGPLVSIATAKANAKKGISNILAGGEDFPWVCTCEPFPAFARTVNDKKKCPYDSEMGCFTPVVR